MLYVCLGVFLSATATWGQDKVGKVDVHVVNYDGLKQVIQANRGKVVLVDFWFLLCGPCKDRFPHLAELHHKHAKDGLVIVTVSADGSAARARVLDFLTSVQACFINIVIDEPSDFLEQKLRVASFPSYYVFDRQGKWFQFTSDQGDINYDSVDRLLLKMLQEQ